jgi:Fur family transcriptional regulator, ferric uptake regulator
MAETQSTWIEVTLAQLNAAGYRNSAGRRAVVEALGREHCAVSARDIEERLRGTGRDVGRATIYRSLEQLDELHLVTRVDVGDGTARFEPRLPGGEHHHHLICDSCGVVEPFEDEALERAVQRLSRHVDFRVDEHDIVLHGACGRCR